MRLIVTGGGTGGHVYPALEIARLAQSKSVHVAYFGSLRGQEVGLCQTANIPFVGFDSRPIYSFKSIQGLKSLAALGFARRHAKHELRQIAPDVVFSTGGYSSAPVVSAARSLGIPFVIHEQNSVPGRTNRLLAKGSYAVATTFHSTAKHFDGHHVVRTGLPVRQSLRDIAEAERNSQIIPLILVVGGSQGAMTLNEAALGAAKRMVGNAQHWIHVTGPKNFEACYPSFEKLGLKDEYQMFAYLQGDDMARAYAGASVVVCRAGASTLSELAAFRLPSVSIPYPHAHANHQYHNALELQDLGATRMIPQDELRAASLESELKQWLLHNEDREKAASALAKWDVPDASSRIFELIEGAVSRKTR